MRRERGFSLLEMMVVVLVFTIVTGAVFGLLNTAQQRYRAESQVLDSFQAARLGVDQIVREVHTAGYPSRGDFPQRCPGGATIQTGCCMGCPLYEPALNTNVAMNFPTDNNGPGELGVNGCVPGLVYLAGGVGLAGPPCMIPDNIDLIIEEDIDPEMGNGVEWVVYSLRDPNGNRPVPGQPNVLWRGVYRKVATGSLNGNAIAAYNAAGLNANVSLAGMVPIVFNVMNDPTSNNQPGNNMNVENQKLFRYDFDAANGAPTAQKIRTVYINLIVRSQDPDPKTQQFRTVTLRASARRYNN